MGTPPPQADEQIRFPEYLAADEVRSNSESEPYASILYEMPNRIPIEIENGAKFDKFYEQAFLTLQQTTRHQIAKAYIKAIAALGEKPDSERTEPS